MLTATSLKQYNSFIVNSFSTVPHFSLLLFFFYGTSLVKIILKNNQIYLCQTSYQLLNSFSLEKLRDSLGKFDKRKLSPITVSLTSPPHNLILATFCNTVIIILYLTWSIMFTNLSKQFLSSSNYWNWNVVAALICFNILQLIVSNRTLRKQDSQTVFYLFFTLFLKITICTVIMKELQMNHLLNYF